MMQDGANTPSAASRATFKSRVGLVLLVLILIWFASRFFESPLLETGTAAPDWKLPLADGSGKTLSLTDLRGKVIVLDFWSTTCPPCIREIDELDAIQREFESQGVVVIGVAAGGETVAEIIQFRKRKRVEYSQIVDSGETATAYRAFSLPTLYIIDRQGRVAASHRGFWNRDGIKSALREVLEQR